jgi:hypothetical protein
VALLCCHIDSIDELVWGVLERFFDAAPIEVYKRENYRNRITFRVNNDLVPPEDVEIELIVYAPEGIQPFVIEVKLLSNGLL